MSEAHYPVLLLFLLSLLSCADSTEKGLGKGQWVIADSIPLGDIAPIGVAGRDTVLWLSDVDHNQVVQTDLNGQITYIYRGFQRPMHLAAQGTKVYIPEYTSDDIRVLENGQTSTLSIPLDPDAISAVAVSGYQMALADFYNHRILFRQDKRFLTIGEEGHEDGQLYYPTDVALHGGLIYVADAYNNRVQVFDTLGQYVRIIGWQENIKVAAGVEVTDEDVLLTDLEGNRILVYGHDGHLRQILRGPFDQPTDIAFVPPSLYVANYKGHFLTVIKRQANTRGE